MRRRDRKRERQTKRGRQRKELEQKAPESDEEVLRGLEVQEAYGHVLFRPNAHLDHEVEGEEREKSIIRLLN